MDKIKNVKAKQNIEKDFININSGEMIMSEIPDLAYIVKNTDQVIIDYKEFVVMNSEVVEFLTKNLNPAELGRVLQLSHTIKSNWNILHNKKTNLPYELNEIAEAVFYTRDKFHKFIQKLYKASIVYKLKGYWDGVEKTVYILNPHLAKCTKTINKEILVCFEDLSDKKIQSKIEKLLNLK